jgi:RNA polymerase sigma factor (sigma-70 family)
MNGTAPLELGRLLHAPSADLREAAWDELIARHTRLILAAAHHFGGGQDAAMERYAYILEKLRENDFHRLRAFRTDGRARFSTWLTVASRRLCLDHYRIHYGRTRETRDPDTADSLRTFRRRLADSLGAELDADLLTDPDAASAEGEVIRADRNRKLMAEVAKLPPQDRLLLVYRFEDDLTASRIAALLDEPTPFHIFRRLSHILARLRVGLEATGISNSDG